MKSATREEIGLIPAPKRTSTWNPIPHSHIITALDAAMEMNYLNLYNRTEYYELNMKGTQMFGFWKFSLGDGKYCPTIGFRNSVDKSLAFGIVSGLNVMVCSNLQFYGDHKNHIIHSGDFDMGVAIQFAGQEIAKSSGLFAQRVRWMEGLKGIHGLQFDSRVYLYYLFQQQIITSKGFSKYMKCYEQEQKLNHNTLYSLYGGATRYMKRYNLNAQQTKSRKLEVLTNDFIRKDVSQTV